jgi:glycerophosphoryl diester phosphodiesterase
MRIWNQANCPLLYAHRGANREFPENGVEAIRRALVLGADVIELDIRATRDGVFVASHDPTGERCAGVLRRIVDCDWTEVCGWDAGWGFADAQGHHPFRGQRLRIARFEELLEGFATTPFNVDVKDATPRQVEHLAASIRALSAEDRVLLTSFSRRTISAIERSKYSGPIGLSRFDVARLLLAPEWLSRELSFVGSRVQVPVNSGVIDLSQPAFIDKCHRLGMAVDYWVINDRRLAATLLDRGADGIVTDDPGAIAQLFRESPRTAGWRERHGSTNG